jgi:probable addiction module antidote protein
MKNTEKVTFSDFDPAKYINTKDDVIALLEVALEENDPDFLLSVFGDIARSKGMSKIAKELNLDRKGLYKALAPDGNPSFKTVFKLLDILGLRIRLEQKSA